MDTCVELDCTRLQNRDAFHDEFSRLFGFPNFYGRNMNAWIDCMSSLSEPQDEMTKIHCERGKVITLLLKNALWLKSNHQELYDAIVECSAFVNYRLLKVGRPPVLALAFYE